MARFSTARRNFLVGVAAGGTMVAQTLLASERSRGVEQSILHANSHKMVVHSLAAKRILDGTGTLVAKQMKVSAEQLGSLGQVISSMYLAIEPTGIWQLKLWLNPALPSRYESPLCIIKVFVGESERPSHSSALCIDLGDVAFSNLRGRIVSHRGFDGRAAQHFGSIRLSTFELNLLDFQRATANSPLA